MAKPTSVVKPNLGLYLDRPPIALPPGALQDGFNFRIQLGQLNNLNLGWLNFNSLVLNGPVTLIQTFMTSAGGQFLIFGTPTDLYYYPPGGPLVYITPTYNAGTASASGTAVTGTTTAWNTTPAGSTWANAKPGDQISFGSATVNAVSATWYTIQSVTGAGSLTLTTSAGSIGSGAYTIRRRFTATDLTTPWFTEVFVDANPAGKDLIFFTNGLDNVCTWNGSDLTATQQIGFGFTCKYLCQFKDTMCYFNVIQGTNSLGTTMLNSDAGSPLNVGNASSGIAGQFIIQGGTDPIVNAFRIGDYLAIYCNRTIIMVQSVGQPLTFVFRIAVQNKGPIASKGISVFPYNHQFIGPDSMYTFDGNSAQPLNTHIWRSVLSTMDHLRQQNIFTFLDEQNGEQIWSVPQTDDPGSGVVNSPPNTAWTEHYLEETAGQTQSALIASAMGLNRPYSKRRFPFTTIGNAITQTGTIWTALTQQWKSLNYRWTDSFFGASFPTVLAGDNSGNLWQLNATQDQNGVSDHAFVVFGRRPLVDGRMRAMLRRIYPFTTTFSNFLNVTCAFADFASSPAQRTASFAYDQSNPEGTFFVPVYRRGRYLDLSFGDITTNTWILNGYDIDVLPGGMR